MSETDVIVVGAGPAGLAASLRLKARGLTVQLIEARDRIGGRTHTVNIGKHSGIDLGAHWMHATGVNPMVKIAKENGISLLNADKWPIVIDGEDILGTWGQMRLWRAWRKIDKGIVRLADCKPGSSADISVDRTERWSVIAGELHGTHACGTSLANVSVEDFANAEDSDDRFVEGGFGALVARAGQGAEARTGVIAARISETEAGVEIHTNKGKLTARAAILTLPAPLIASQAINADFGWPDAHIEAAAALPHGAYERLVFTLNDDPFVEERDRAVILINKRNEQLYMLAGGGGPGVHFADFGGDEARHLASNGQDAMVEAVKDWLDWQVGSSVARSLKPLAASNWCGDPLSMGAWSVAKPGQADARLRLRAPIHERIWFAGEATSINMWGTVGGAWLDGIRAADEVGHVLTLSPGRRNVFDWTRISKIKRPRSRSRNLT
jgi:monoamine oxidase